MEDRVRRRPEEILAELQRAPMTASRHGDSVEMTLTVKLRLFNDFVTSRLRPLVPY